MKRIIIFGNSGSGKSTLAKEYADKYELEHLDLDLFAWEDTNPPQRKTLRDSHKEIEVFINQNKNWVIEGCYADLLLPISEQATKMVFINPGVDTCIENCKKRPWEPHKYESKEAQDKNLEMLIDWIKDYENRNDEFSLQAHRELFDQFDGNKVEFNSNKR